MNDQCQDFGTGLRAHLGLEVAGVAVETSEPATAPESPPLEQVVELAPPAARDDLVTLEAELAQRAHELALRKHFLEEREQLLERRSTALLAQVQALYAEMHGEVPALEDELAVRRAARPA